MILLFFTKSTKIFVKIEDMIKGANYQCSFHREVTLFLRKWYVKQITSY
jgi:hypothetical protein